MSSLRNTDQTKGRADIPSPEDPIHGGILRTSRAVAVAGILFSALLLTAFVLLLQSAGIRTADPTTWPGSNRWAVTIAINLIPFAAIAFLWFVGVLRDRLGTREDKLFATVFLGSGLLFTGLLLVAAAAIGALAAVFPDGATAPETLPTIRFIRHFAYNVAGVYALKMAAVFMLTASTLMVRTSFTSRWTAVVGYGAGLLILLAGQRLDWTVFLFPLWVLLVSASVLLDESKRR